MSGADASFPMNRLIPIQWWAAPSVAFYSKWHKHFCKTVYYLCYNYTEFSPHIAEYNLEIKNAGQKISNPDVIMCRQLRDWSFIFLFLESPRPLAQLSVWCCEWEGEVARSQENNRGQDATILPCIPASDYFTCRAVPLVWNTQMLFPGWPLLLLLHSALSHSYSYFIPQLKVSGHRAGACPPRLALLVGLTQSLSLSLPASLTSLCLCLSLNSNYLKLDRY